VNLEAIYGTVEIFVPPGKKIEHLGIKVEMIGQIGPSTHFISIKLFFIIILRKEVSGERQNTTKFTSLVRELHPPGTLNQNMVRASLLSILFLFLPHLCHE